MRVGLQLGQVAGLAHRLHDSPMLQAEFKQIVKSLNPDGTTKTQLDRRVPTCWNTDFLCLKTHSYFKNAIQILTQKDSLGLEPYTLTMDQWKLAGHLVPILEV